MNKLAAEHGKLLSSEIESEQATHLEVFSGKSLAELAASGVALTSLKLANYRRDEYFKHHLHFQLPSGLPLGKLQFNKRTPVKIHLRENLPESCNNYSEIKSGTKAFVRGIEGNKIEVMCDQLSPDCADVSRAHVHSLGEFVMIQVDNSVSLKQIKENADAIAGTETQNNSRLLQLLGDNQEESLWASANLEGESAEESQISLFNVDLNELQKSAVLFCLRQKYLAAVHGPPG